MFGTAFNKSSWGLRWQTHVAPPTWRCAYSCRSSYLALCNEETSILGAKELWKTRAPRKCIFFMWLALLGHYEHYHCHDFCDSHWLCPLQPTSRSPRSPTAGLFLRTGSLACYPHPLWLGRSGAFSYRFDRRLVAMCMKRGCQSLTQGVWLAHHLRLLVRLAGVERQSL
jgi:hypothetical protein